MRRMAPSPPDVETLLSSPLVLVVDARCRMGPGCRVREVRVGAHHVLFTRSGFFVKHGPDANVIADPARVLFFNAGERFQVSHPVPGGAECTVFAFPAATLRDVLAESGAQARRPPRPFRKSHAPASPALLMAQKTLLGRLRAGTCSVVEAEQAALQILTVAIHDALSRHEPRSDPHRPRTRRAHRDAIRAAQVLLARHPEANPSLAEIGRSVGCSPFQLSRIFRAELGIPLHQYLLRIRLALALERLADGTQDITELALDLGFSSHSHLTRTFTRFFGVSPAAFRKTALVEAGSRSAFDSGRPPH